MGKGKIKLGNWGDFEVKLGISFQQILPTDYISKFRKFLLGITVHIFRVGEERRFIDQIGDVRPADYKQTLYISILRIHEHLLIYEL